jgi:hypothetical protein
MTEHIKPVHGNKGKNKSEEHKVNMSLASKGKPKSVDHRLALAESQQKRRERERLLKEIKNEQQSGN